MLLSLKEAAERAKISTQDLISIIESGSLKAVETLVENSKSYLIALEDLNYFLKNKSFENFWNETENAENEANDTPQQLLAGNLRKVLTAEAVGNLKIEHQILTSRVETLEHLFSEFMEVSKSEPTLILEDDWKIEKTDAGSKQIADESGNVEAGSQENAISEQNVKEHSETAVSSTALKETSKEMSTDAQTRPDPVVNTSHNREEDNGFKDPVEDERKTIALDLNQAQKAQPKLSNVETEVTEDKSNLTKELLSKKLSDISGEKVIERQAENTTPKEMSDAKQAFSGSIEAKLADYERRLAEAKRTATQMWH